MPARRIGVPCNSLNYFLWRVVLRSARAFSTIRPTRTPITFFAASSSVQTTLKFLGHSRQMPMHRCAGGRGIVRRDRAHNGCVVANRLLGKIVGVKVLLHPSPEFRPLIPQARRPPTRANCCPSPWPVASGSRDHCPRVQRSRRCVSPFARRSGVTRRHPPPKLLRRPALQSRLRPLCVRSTIRTAPARYRSRPPPAAAWPARKCPCRREPRPDRQFPAK